MRILKYRITKYYVFKNERNSMDKAKKEREEKKRQDEKFNSVTDKKKVENQNQTHNVVREGTGRIFPRR